MNLLKRIANYPQRWRHSRGFGVHSPFAYHFITRVLRETDAEYYAYAEIAAFCPRARRAGFNEIFAGRDLSIPEAHMLFRVLCHFNPADIIEVGHGHEVTNIIIERGTPNARVTTWLPENPLPDDLKGEPLLAVNQFLPGQADDVIRLTDNLLAHSDAVIVVRNLRSIKANRQLWQHLLSSYGFGMGFTDRFTGIFVGRRSLPKQHFDLSL